MKKLFLLSLFAVSVAMNAQNVSKEDVAAAKAAAKAAKVEAAKALKEFKAKQAEELKAFIEAQKSGKKASVDTSVELKDEADSMAYIFGVANSQGFLNYVVKQLKVDTAYFDSFKEGMIIASSADSKSPSTLAYNEGFKIGGQVVNMANNFTKDYFAADPDKSIDPVIVAKGVILGVESKSTLSADSANSYLQRVMPLRHAANNERLYGENKKAGEQFLAENAKKAGVVTLPSGLQYKVLVEGDVNSARASKTDDVKVNYEGRLVDGTVFDSSYKRGNPTTFKANRVIAGWTEALTLMPVGAKWELYIPYDLAYGDRDQGEIKPYSTLIFVVELLENETASKNK